MIRKLFILIFIIISVFSFGFSQPLQKEDVKITKSDIDYNWLNNIIIDTENGIIMASNNDLQKLEMKYDELFFKKANLFLRKNNDNLKITASEYNFSFK